MTASALVELPGGPRSFFFFLASDWRLRVLAVFLLYEVGEGEFLGFGTVLSAAGAAGAVSVDSGNAPSAFRLCWDPGLRRPARRAEDAPGAGGPGKRKREREGASYLGSCGFSCERTG